MRSSRYLPHRAAANLTRGLSFAAELGRPLNVMVSINYGLTSCGPEHMSAAFEKMRDNHFCPWFRRHPHQLAEIGPRGPATYVWVAEGKPGHHNVHWMVFIPPALRAVFEANLVAWLERTAGPILDKKALHIQTAKTPRRATNYLLKGLQPRHAERFGVDAVFQGEVAGKRCGISKNIGPAAIKRRADGVQERRNATGRN